jgi:hypothetical protein
MPKVAGNVVEEGGRWLPPMPRIMLAGVEIVPLVDDAWQPVKDQWMLPGRAHPLSTQEVRDLASANDLAFELIDIQ